MTRHSAESLRNALNDVLDFSQGDAGQMHLKIAPFDLALLVAESVEMLMPRAVAKGLALRWHYPPDSPRHFLGDGGKIRQILVNLVGNALKFTHAGGVRIHAAVREIERARAEVQIAILDTGIGIDATRCAMCLTHFSRLNVPARKTSAGSGLGPCHLPPVRDSHGGNAVGGERTGPRLDVYADARSAACHARNRVA